MHLAVARCEILIDFFQYPLHKCAADQVHAQMRVNAIGDMDHAVFVATGDQLSAEICQRHQRVWQDVRAFDNDVPATRKCWRGVARFSL